MTLIKLTHVSGVFLFAKTGTSTIIFKCLKNKVIVSKVDRSIALVHMTAF